MRTLLIFLLIVSVVFIIGVFSSKKEEVVHKSPLKVIPNYTIIDKNKEYTTVDYEVLIDSNYSKDKLSLITDEVLQLESRINTQRLTFFTSKSKEANLPWATSSICKIYGRSIQMINIPNERINVPNNVIGKWYDYQRDWSSNTLYLFTKGENFYLRKIHHEGHYEDVLLSIPSSYVNQRGKDNRPTFTENRTSSHRGHYYQLEKDSTLSLYDGHHNRDENYPRLK